VDSGFGNSIYWSLPVVTTIIHFTTLQRINQILYLLSSVFRTALPGRRIFTSVFLAPCWTLDSGTLLTILCVSVSASASPVNSVSHPLKRVFRELNTEHLIEGLSLSVVTKTTPPLCRKRLRRCENNCLLTRYNVNACVQCLGNNSSIPAVRHSVTVLISN
jgi:hypothetical protein